MGQPTLLRCGTVCGGGVTGGKMPLVPLLPCFHSLSLLPTSSLCPFRCCSGADSQVGGLVYILWSCGPLQQIHLWNWEFLLPQQSAESFTARGFEVFISPCCNSGLCDLSHSPVTPPSLSAYKCETSRSTSSHLATCPLHPCFPSPTLLPSLDECLFFNSLVVDFHTVRVSGSSGCFLFLNWLLSFYWLCKEKKAYLPIPPCWLEAALYTWNLHNIICHLYLNGSGKNKKKGTNLGFFIFQRLLLKHFSQ